MFDLRSEFVVGLCFVGLGEVGLGRLVCQDDDLVFRLGQFPFDGAALVLGGRSIVQDQNRFGSASVAMAEFGLERGVTLAESCVGIIGLGSPPQKQDDFVFNVEAIEVVVLLRFDRIPHEDNFCVERPRLGEGTGSERLVDFQWDLVSRGVDNFECVARFEFRSVGDLELLIRVAVIEGDIEARLSEDSFNINGSFVQPFGPNSTSFEFICGQDTDILEQAFFSVIEFFGLPHIRKHGQQHETETLHPSQHGNLFVRWGLGGLGWASGGRQPSEDCDGEQTRRADAHRSPLFTPGL